jgi:hypothetical protein
MKRPARSWRPADDEVVDGSDALVVAEGHANPLIGLLRGRGNWQARTAARLSVEAGLIGILPIILASVVIGVFSSGPAGVTYFVDGIMLAPALGGSEILVAVMAVQGGRLIGSRFLNRQSGTE